MGDEARCTVHWQGRESEGNAHLERDTLRFRGDFRLSIPLVPPPEVKVTDGMLEIASSEGWASFDLGAPAEKWADKIRHPRTLMDRLGVKPGLVAAVVGVDDPGFLEQLGSSGARVGGAPEGDVDILFFGAKARNDLRRLGDLRTKLKRNGALWVIRPKGVHRITEQDVMKAGREAELVDVKVASFSATHTAEKFVIPRSNR